MKTVLSTMLAVALVFAVVAGITAADDKEVTLKGNVTCAKCELKVDGQKKCATVVVVKEKDKDVVYWFDPTSDKKFHKDICSSGKKGTVVGTVEEKDKKKVITVKKVDYE
ncbi:MAG: hypothetical protein K2R98_06910 [Gemmataceae bacterium]|nr:hypothetical protein [Gemmataceae bacterium]